MTGTAYDAAAAGWASGAERIYAPLARALVETSPEPVVGRLVADVGAGTGAASRVLLKKGARVVALDLSEPMLRHGREHRPPAVVGDVLRLPLGTGTMDGAVAAFVVNHVDPPQAAFAALRRILRADGVVLASAFSSRHRLPVKDAADAVCRDFGWEPPTWYAELHERIAPVVGTPEGMAGAAGASGLDVVDAAERPVEVGTLDAQELAGFRLGQAHLAEFLADLDPSTRRRLHDAVVDACEPHAGPTSPWMVTLTARVCPT